MKRREDYLLERLSVVILAKDPSCVVKEVNCGRSIQYSIRDLILFITTRHTFSKAVFKEPV